MKKLENNPMSGLMNQRKMVSVETITQSFNIIRIYLTDEGVNGTDSHLDQLEAILDATSNDVIEVYCLGCGGGSADSIIMLLNALAQSPAHTVTILEGHNASAASMPMMVTDEVRIGMYSSVMFHNVAGGVIGNMTNNAEAAKFYEQHYNRFFADLYNHFFDESELSDLRKGLEIYLNAEQIRERLDNRQRILEEECDCDECSEQACEATPCDDTCSNLENPCKECLELPEIVVEPLVIEQGFENYATSGNVKKPTRKKVAK